MKKAFLLIVVLLITKMAFCQAPIIDSTWLPKVGDKYYKYGSTPVPSQSSFLNIPVVSANDTGANVTWDYNSYSPPFDKVDSFDFALPATRNISCSNKAANFVSGNSDVYDCYVKSNSGIYKADYESYLGSGIGYNVVYYTRPEVFMKANLNFRQSFHDTSVSYYYNTTGHSQTDSNWHQIRKRLMTYDGYGTLKIGGRVFDSVVRIHETAIQEDSVYEGNSYSKVYTLDNYYNWYIASIHTPILTIERSWEATHSQSGYDTNYHAPNVPYMAFSLPANGSLSALSSPRAFGNATANMAEGYIAVHNTKGQKINYSVYDSQGKLVFSGKPDVTGADNWQISSDVLSPGVYILKLQNDKGEATSIKLVKDH